VVIFEGLLIGATVLAVFCEFPILREVSVHSGGQHEDLVTDGEQHDDKGAEADEIRDSGKFYFL